MTSSPLVSIVMPVFLAAGRQAALLDETLDTVTAQGLRDYEVIVVDDGSPVDVDAVTGRHPRTRTLRRANGGSAAARNTGIAASRAAFVVFLDGDDHLLPGALETGLRALEQHAEAGFAVGAREEMTFEGTPVPWSIAPPPPQARIYEPLLAFEWYIIPPSSAIFRREVIDSVGGFRDPWGADDLDFYLRAAWAFPACCHQASVTRYRRYSTSSSRDGERMLRSIRAVYARQRPLVRGNPRLEAAFARGLTQLTDIFVDCLVENVTDRVQARRWRPALRSAVALARERPGRLIEAARRLQSTTTAALPGDN